MLMNGKEGINRPTVSQPLCTALQLALIELLRSFAVEPKAVAGHSSGEIAAAYAIRALSHESACKVAYFRGQVAEKVRIASLSRPGAMMSVNLTEDQLPAYLDELQLKNNTIHVACINSPTNITLSGYSDSLDILKERSDQLGIFAQKVNTGVAYHSPTMQAVASEYLQLIEPLQTGLHGKAVSMISSVTGQIVTPKQLRMAQYWVDNLLSPVKFTAALKPLNDGPPSLPLPLGVSTITDLIEIGPHSALKRPMKDTISSLTYHSVLQRNKSPMRTTLELLGTLFSHGYPVSVTKGNSQDTGNFPFLVDCPPYPFDHSKKYWSESRLSRDYRLRKPTFGYLIGRSAHDWNPLQPKWRNWLSTEAIPWLADHVVNDTTICPGTGMLVMALEAAMHAAASKDCLISGFLIKNASFLAPNIVRDKSENSIETVIELRPIQNVFQKNLAWFEVSIFSYANNNWRLCFKADIEVQSDDGQISAPSWANETAREHARIHKHVESDISACARKIDRHCFYTFCEDIGIEYGPTFQLLSDIAWDGQNTSTARIDMTSANKIHKFANSPVHPAVLGAVLHLLVAHTSKGIAVSISTFVPHQINEVWISAKTWNQTTSSLRVSSFTHASSDSLAKKEGSVYVIGDDGTPLCTMDRLVTAGVARPTVEANDGAAHTLLHSITWQPQLSSLSTEALQQHCKVDTCTRSDEVMKTFYPKIESAMRMSARKALRELSDEEVGKASDYLKKYLTFLENQFGRQPPSGSDHLSDSALELLLQECETEQPDWRMFTAVARALPSIIRGEEDPLELLFSSKAAEDFYMHSFASLVSDERLSLFLDLATHEKPSLKLLEVGAGTGSMTRSILATIKSFENKTGQTRFGEYTYTDISPYFFGKARKKFEEFGDRMLFKTLDLEIDPLKQGFQAATYDVVLAGSVLHATSDLAATLERLQKLLKPGGHIIFLEITSPNSACANVGFGSLEGWWASSEEWRQHGPLVTTRRWDALLRQTGFSGVELSSKDYHNDACHLLSILVSRSLGPRPNLLNAINSSNEKNVVVVIDPKSDDQHKLAAQITAGQPHAKVQFFPQAGESQLDLKPSNIVVFLLEVGASQLAKLNDADFQTMRTSIQNSQEILWVASPDSNTDLDTAPLSVSTGFFRSFRNEQNRKHIVSLSIESCPNSTEANLISRLLESCFIERSAPTEVEYVIRDGQLTIGRLREEGELEGERISRVCPKLISEPLQPGPPLTLQVGTPAILETLQFFEDCSGDLDPNEVEIEAVVWPVSFRDVFITTGRLGNEKMGFECAGIVSRVGSACAIKFCPGERVLMVSLGCMRSHPRAPADSIFKLPGNLSFHEAVAGMNPGMTAWYALNHVACLQPGEKILIHAAAGSTGQMAVKIAKMLGAEVFATVGSEEKRQLVMDPNGLGIPESHIFYSRDTSFAKGLMRVTSGYGVDVVLNSLSGRSLLASWECVAPYGRFVDIGKSDIMSNSSLPMGGFAKCVSFSSVDLHHMVLTNTALTRQLVEKVLNFAADQKIGGPAPLHTFLVSEAEKAFRYMQSGKNTGRTIISLSSHDVVPKYLARKSSWQFDANASYLIAGGLGGLGRTIIQWMADRGAKNIIVPSRSGAASQAASTLISELQSRGVNIVAPHCDVSSVIELKGLLQDNAHMPPIKGCMNLAMALQDAVFDNMTHAQWECTIRTKVASSWNLHRLLPENLDFFILTSSVAGIYGLPSQSNYAAGSTFLDALARLRTTNIRYGTSVSLDLGWMQSIGIIAERADYRRVRERARDMVPIQTEDLLALLEHYCDPELPRLMPDQSQVLVGIKTPMDSYMAGETPPAHLKVPLFSPFDVKRLHYSSARSGSAGEKDAEGDAIAAFWSAPDLKSRSEAVICVLKKSLIHALSVQAEDIDTRKSLSEYGVDSLMAMEMRNLIWRDFRVSVAVFEIMGGLDIKGVAEMIAGKVEM